MKLQVSTLVTIVTAALICGGFYYTTQFRLDNLENQVTSLSKQIKKTNRRNKTKNTRTK